MDAPLRLLLVADPAAAAQAVEPLQRHTVVEAALAPTPAVLAAALRDAVWDAVLLVPGGPVTNADAAILLAASHDAPPLIVVTDGGVPPALAAVAALALPPDGIDALPFVLTSLSAERTAEALEAGGDSAPAFVATANATLAASVRAEPGLSAGFADLVPAAPASPSSVFVAAANATLAASARATAALPEALAAASHAPAEASEPAPATASDTPPGTVPEMPHAAPRRPLPMMTREAEALAQSLPVGVYRTSPDGRILYANPALAEVLGVESVEALARIDVRRDLGYPRDAFADELLRSGAVRNHTVGWTNPRGERVYTRENARAVLDGAGRLVCYEGTMEDVTAEVLSREDERMRARHHEAIVRFSEAADVSGSPDGLARAAVDALLAATQADWTLLVLHDAAGDGVGHGRNTVAASAGRLPDDAAAALSADPDFGSIPVMPEPVLLRDAESPRVGWLPASIAELLRAHRMRALGCFPMRRAGTPLGALVVGYSTPHTFSPGERQAAEVLAWHLAGHLARHRAEQDLRDSEASLRFIAARSAQTLYRLRYTSGEPVFDYLSPAVEALTGYAPAELAAVGGLAALVEHRTVFAGAGLFRGPDPNATHYHAVYRFRTRSGGTRWVENHAYPWHDDAGETVGLVGALQDVTERQLRDDALADEAQQALARQSALVELARLDRAEDAFRRAAELACEAAGADAASVWLADGPALACRAHYATAATQAPPALPAGALAVVLSALDGQRALAIDDAQTDARLSTAAGRALAAALGGRAFVAVPVCRGTETVGLLLVCRTDAAPDEAPPAAWTEAETDFAGALADAVALAAERAERAAAEQALRRSEARYRVLSDLTSDYAFAVSTDAAGQSAVEWATDTFERITGYIPGRTLTRENLGALIHPESRDAVHEALDELARTGQMRVEAQITTRDGQTRWLQHSARVDARATGGGRLVYHSGEDVTERKQFEADLVAAREAAEASRAEAETMVRLKTAFLANMSHEIRTPLTAILGYSELLGEEVSGEQRALVESISSSGHRLLDTLNSVLDLAQLEADGVRPELRPVDVAAGVRQAVGALGALATRRGLSLDVTTDGTAMAALDAACLGRIVTNLVGNALKFTETGGVVVAVDTAPLPDGSGPGVRLRVRDTGIGIPEEFRPHLFDEFRQETDGEARSHEGSGLGLAITQRLTRLMGGTIAVESRRPGGSTFTVTFPALAAAPPGQDDPPLASTAPPAALPADVLPVDSLHARALFPAGPADSFPGAATLSPPSPPAPDRLPAVALDLRGSTPSPSLPAAPAQTAMFDFRFSSSRAPSAPPAPAAPSREPAPEVEWTAEPPVPAPARFAPPAIDASPAAEPAVVPPTMTEPSAARASDSAVPEAPAAPDAPRPAWPVDPAAGGQPPVMIVRPARPDPPRAEPPTEGPAVPESPALPVEGGEPRLPILVVEDNLDTRVLLDRILRGAYAVTAVGDARSALTAMAQTRFRALVLDINLGGKETGTDILRVARSLDGYGDVFAVALTAYALPGDRERLLESGFDEYISKPFTRQSLTDALSLGIRS
ncbi:MAG TPA: ATP-binding protein [Rubricoccaceae bacterium]